MERQRKAYSERTQYRITELHRKSSDLSTGLYPALCIKANTRYLMHINNPLRHMSFIKFIIFLSASEGVNNTIKAFFIS